MGNRICFVEGCERPRRALGLCDMHWKRHRKGADLSPVSTRGEPWDVRFWHRVDIAGDCWVWTGATNARGYGVISIGGRMLLAHRLAYAMRHGDLPPADFICHHCDTPGCVNPDHLYAGDAAANFADVIQRNRRQYLRGPERRWTRLSPSQKQAIRDADASGITRTELAARYGVAPLTIRRAIREATP